MMNLDRSKLLKEVKEAFSAIRAEINAQQGLLHFEVGVFYMHTQKLINNGEREKVTKSFKIADKFVSLNWIQAAIASGFKADSYSASNIGLPVRI